MMPTFRYIAKDAEGKNVTDMMEAQGKQAVIDNLREKKLVIMDITEQRTQAKKAFSISMGKRVKLDDLVVFSRQLATMVSAGITILSAFDILAEQTENPNFRSTLRKVHDDIQTGSSLSDSLRKHPLAFSPLFVNMVKAGESSGTLDEILDRVATYLEKTGKLIRKIRAALVYPALISVMAVIITGVLLIKVIPVFEDVFMGFGAELPIATQILIKVSEIIRTYFFLITGALILAGVFVYMRLRTESGRAAFDKLVLNMPIFGKLVKKVAISKFARTLSTLTKSGVPILTSLEIVAKTAGNKVVEKAVIEVSKNIREGEKIAEPLSKSGVFPPIVVRMIAIGEETGELETMLSKISDFYDDQVDAAVSGLTSMIEPLIIAFLGIVIGTIVICMFLPIFKISEIVQM